MDTGKRSSNGGETNGWRIEKRKQTRRRSNTVRMRMNKIEKARKNEGLVLDRNGNNVQ
jgi:hypothetical protein